MHAAAAVAAAVRRSGTAKCAPVTWASLGTRSMTTTARPAPGTELGSRSGAVLGGVRSGQPGPVTRHGSVVGVFQPTNAAAALRLGIDLDDRSRSVSARELERGNPSAVIDRVADGETVLVT